MTSLFDDVSDDDQSSDGGGSLFGSSRSKPLIGQKTAASAVPANSTHPTIASVAHDQKSDDAQEVTNKKKVDTHLWYSKLQYLTLTVL